MTWNGAFAKRGVNPYQQLIDMAFSEDSLFVRDDFLAHLGSSGSGELGWTWANGTTTATTSSLGHPGILRRDTGSGAGTVTYTRLASSGANLLPAEMFDATWIFRQNDADTDTAIRIGFGVNSASNPPDDGIFLEKVYADTQWFAVTRASASQTRTVLATCDTGWHRLRIRRIDASTIGFVLDDGGEVLHTTSIPTVGFTPFMQIVNQSAASKTVDYDYFSLAISGLSR